MGICERYLSVMLGAILSGCRKHSRLRILAAIFLGIPAFLHGPVEARAWGVMDTSTLERMEEEQLLAWSQKNVGPYRSTIMDAAKRHNIPARLLGSCILAELGDYDRLDQMQEAVPPPFNRRNARGGSVGIAQITLRTAIDHGLVDVSDAEITNYLGASYGPNWRTFNPQARQNAYTHAKEFLVWSRLNDPPIAIDAAAREIRLIIATMNRNLHKPWQRHFFTGTIDSGNPYANVKINPLIGRRHPVYRDSSGRPLRQEQEKAVALAVCAAYNAFGIITSDVPGNPYQKPKITGNYTDARKQGNNAADFFAAMLAENNWYSKPVWSRADDSGTRNTNPCANSDDPACQWFKDVYDAAQRNQR